MRMRQVRNQSATPAPSSVREALASYMSIAMSETPLAARKVARARPPMPPPLLRDKNIEIHVHGLGNSQTKLTRLQSSDGVMFHLHFWPLVL